MNINKVEYSRTAVLADQYPTDGLPEIAFVGRSNVGKSSLINLLVNRKALARVSSTPGKTRTINFFILEDKFYFVDLPGYGYAKVSKNQREEDWEKMINAYLHEREQLKLFVLLVDIRHEPSFMDCMMVEWMKKYGIKFLIAATKSDKLNNAEKEEAIKSIAHKLNIAEKVIPISALKRTGKDELWECIDEALKDFI